MNQRAALLFANDRFYRAFADADMQGMAALWAPDGPLTCLHPGWAPLTTREDVLASFGAIFDGPAPPAVMPVAAQVVIHGSAGIVICYEKIGGDYLVATNIFRQVTAGSGEPGWYLVHHQAGPVNEPPPKDENPPDAIN